MAYNQSGTLQEWSGDIDDLNYYYYDHRHTTGTDAKIPLNTIGAAFLNKNSRYRDVVQSIYRMRQLEAPNGHKIVFVINNKLENLIKSMCGIDPSVGQINMENLIKWFNILETQSLKQQTDLAIVQNIKSLARFKENSEPIIDNVFTSTNKFNFFNTLKNRYLWFYFVILKMNLLIII